MTSAPSYDQFSDRPLWQWSARALADAIRAKAITSTDAVAASLDRSAAVNPHLNALVEISAEEALAAAATFDRKGPSAGTGALHGVPIALKDNVEQAGHRNSGGVVFGSEEVAERDAPVTAALKSGGAVIVGRSNVPAFSLRWFSENDLYGRTLNPWGADLTPGGSSGGAASAVAAGMVPIAHGNDVGGSIRYPAWACGVTGIRPTVGRVPMWSPTPSWPGVTPAPAAMSVEGPIARHVDDLRLALEVMATAGLHDPTSVPVPYVDAPRLSPGAKVGVVRDIPGVATDQSSLDAVDRAAGWLADAGYDVIDLEVPELVEAHRLWFLLLFEDFRPALPVVEQIGDDAIKVALVHYYEAAREMWGPEPTLAEYLEGHSRRTAIVHAMQVRFDEVPLLLTPVSANAIFHHGDDLGAYESVSPLLAGQWPMTSVPSLGLPAVSVPTGLADGVPTGVQIIGGRFCESWILDAAEAIERRGGVLTPIDPADAS